MVEMSRYKVRGAFLTAGVIIAIARSLIVAFTDTCAENDRCMFAGLQVVNRTGPVSSCSMTNHSCDRKITVRSVISKVEEVLKSMLCLMVNLKLTSMFVLT